jgi:hypothetical protein
MNGYELSRNFVDFSFENPSKIKPNHYALYFFSIEHCNRLGWKKEFGLPTTMTMEAIGIKSYSSYIKTFNELVDLGFYNLVERSKNQYSANIIELSKNVKAHNKALDKAFVKHASKQHKSTHESIDSIDKPINNKPINKETINKEPVEDLDFKCLMDLYSKQIGESGSDIWRESVYRKHKIKHGNLRELVDHFIIHLGTQTGGEYNEPFNKFRTYCSNWIGTEIVAGRLAKFRTVKQIGSI